MQSTAPSHSTGRSSLTHPDAIGTGPLETLLLRLHNRSVGVLPSQLHREGGHSAGLWLVLSQASTIAGRHTPTGNC